MKTIQMTIDDRLLQLVDKMSRARKTTRSAFIRDALEAEIRRQRIREDEARHAEEGTRENQLLPGENSTSGSMSRIGRRIVNRGDICWYTFKAPDKRRPVLIVTRDSAIGCYRTRSPLHQSPRQSAVSPQKSC